MPNWLAWAPRQKLPPPTTTATWMPRSLAVLICAAMRLTAPGSMPKARSPIRASPLTFNKMRLYGASPICALLLAKLESREPPDADVLPRRGDSLLHKVLDGLRGVLDERLLHEHRFLGRALGVGRELVLGDGEGRRDAGDLHGDVVDQRLEGIGAGHEVGLAVDFDDNADAAARVDVGVDDPLAGLASGLLVSPRHALLPQPLDRLVYIAIRCFQGALTVHNARASELP